MCIWRNSTRNVPIYADIVARIIHVYPTTLYLSVLCFLKFTWNITRPSPALKVVDRRIRHNYIDAFICIGFTLLFSILLVFTSRGRYKIVEDLGPFPVDRPSLEGFVCRVLPLGVIAVIAVGLSILTGINIWRARRRSGPATDSGSRRSLDPPDQASYRPLSTAQAIKYSALAATNIIGMLFGFLWAIIPLWTEREKIAALNGGVQWYTIFDIRDNLKQLPLTHTVHREEIEGWENVVGFLISIPINGILFVLLFGIDSDALGTYRKWLQSLCQQSSNILSSLRPYIMKVSCRLGSFSPSQRRGIDHITPFQPDEIALEALPPPAQTTTTITTKRSKVYPPNNDGPGYLLPPTLPLHATAHQLSPQQTTPLERSRTFRKEPTPMTELSPVNRSSSCDDHGQREASSSSHCRPEAGGGGGEPSGHRSRQPRGEPSSRQHNFEGDEPPPYDAQPEELAISRQNSTLSNGIRHNSVP
ncbi:hypothetical protein FRC17_000912 [Serendipita sp. 399]|nr:hypothetical protein FRC17_000912 [Serendipita sp. 399]